MSINKIYKNQQYNPDYVNLAAQIISSGLVE